MAGPKTPDQGTYTGPVGAASDSGQSSPGYDSTAGGNVPNYGGLGIPPGGGAVGGASNTTGYTPPPITSGSALMSDPSYQAYVRTQVRNLGVGEGNAIQQGQYDTTNAQNALQNQALSNQIAGQRLQGSYSSRGLGFGSGQQLNDSTNLAVENGLRVSAINQALAQQLATLQQQQAANAATANENITNYGITRAPGVDLSNMGTVPTDPNGMLNYLIFTGTLPQSAAGASNPLLPAPAGKAQ